MFLCYRKKKKQNLIQTNSSWRTSEATKTNYVINHCKSKNFKYNQCSKILEFFKFFNRWIVEFVESARADDKFENSDTFISPFFEELMRFIETSTITQTQEYKKILKLNEVYKKPNSCYKIGLKYHNLSNLQSLNVKNINKDIDNNKTNKINSKILGFVFFQQATLTGHHHASLFYGYYLLTGIEVKGKKIFNQDLGKKLINYAITNGVDLKIASGFDLKQKII